MATYEGKKALIVDDFPTARRLIKETLQEIGFECVEAADVDQALKLFDEEKVDLVIADTFMPEKNGMDLLKTLRENPENEELEIVLTMMEDHEELVSQGETLGMTGYVLKPFDVFSLSKSLNVIQGECLPFSPKMLTPPARSTSSGTQFPAAISGSIHSIHATDLAD